MIRTKNIQVTGKYCTPKRCLFITKTSSCLAWIISATPCLAFCLFSCEIEKSVIPTVNAPKIVVEAPNASRSITMKQSVKKDTTRRVKNYRKFLNAKKQAKIKINKAKISGKKESLQHSIDMLPVQELVGMSKGEWRILLDKAGHIKSNKTVIPIPYEELNRTLRVVGSLNPSVVSSCAFSSPKNYYFAAFESKHHYFILSHEKQENLRSTYPHWQVCRKKDHVKVFDLLEATWAMEPPKNGIVTGHGCGTYGPEGEARFTRQRGKIPAIIFQGVICMDSGNELYHTVLFDSRGVSKVIQHPKNKTVKRSR